MNDFTYEKVSNEFGNEIIKRTDKNDYVLWIPLDATNSDYIAYLASLDESTVLPETTEPVDESEPTNSADEPLSDTE
jgi:hypothetical protein